MRQLKHNTFPVTSFNMCLWTFTLSSLSSVVRAMVLWAIGRGFKPRREYVNSWHPIDDKLLNRKQQHSQESMAMTNIDACQPIVQAKGATSHAVRKTKSKQHLWQNRTCRAQSLYSGQFHNQIVLESRRVRATKPFPHFVWCIKHEWSTSCFQHCRSSGMILASSSSCSEWRHNQECWFMCDRMDT